MAAKTIDSIDSKVKKGPILVYISYVWLGRGSKKSLNIKIYKKIVVADQPVDQWINLHSVIESCLNALRAAPGTPRSDQWSIGKIETDLKG